MEGKRNDVGMRFVLDPNAGDGGFLIWNEQVIPALIDWRDPVIQHGLRHTIKYARLIRRKASSESAQGADHDGNKYFVQLVLEGYAFIKPKHEKPGSAVIGLDISPSTLAIVSREGKANLVTFCEELAPNTRKKRRLQRKMDRQRRANNPENYDEKGRVKKHGNTRLRWRESKRYQATRRQHAHAERRLAAHRKSLHGNLAHRIASLGNTITIEKTSFKGWQKQYGRSIGLRAPGMFAAHLTRIAQKLAAPCTKPQPTRPDSLSTAISVGSITRSHDQSAGTNVLADWGRCSVISTRLSRLSYLEPQQTIPSVTQPVWEGAEPRLRAVMEGLHQRANEGQCLPQSMGLLASGKAARARARRLKSPAYPHQEPVVSPNGAARSVG